MASMLQQKLFLFVTIALILGGLCLTIAGVFSPAWQVAAIREFMAEHQHGLWWDCIRAEKHVVSAGDFYNEEPLHCMYKFDNSAEQVIENTLMNIDEDGAAGESEHHRFWAWHKIILFCIITSQIVAMVSMCCGACTPCIPQASLGFTGCIIVAVVLSLIADGVFFLAANRVDNRFVQGVVGTYEQRIGYAFYVHMGGTLCWMGAALLAVGTAYKVMGSDHEDTYGGKEPYHWQQNARPTPLNVRVSSF